MRLLSAIVLLCQLLLLMVQMEMAVSWTLPNNRRNGRIKLPCRWKPVKVAVSMVNSNLITPEDEIMTLVNEESQRQKNCLSLIASENIVSSNVLKALGSCLVNKYSEGYPGKRYYAGNAVIDRIETMCQQRALQFFGLSESEWTVNVQPYSGTPANFAVYTALLQPGDCILGLSLNCGGHLSHGHQTPTKKVTSASKYFRSVSYGLNPMTELIDYEQVEALADIHRPKLIIAGASAYSRDWDYNRMKHIASKVNALLMADIAHTAGLVGCKLLNNPFDYCDVVTSTTQKSLRGPRGGLIFCKKEYEKEINAAVFPGTQGGPHNNQIAAVAVALGEALQPSFTAYAKEVVSNSRALAGRLIELGYKVLTNGTDNHIVLISLNRPNRNNNKPSLSGKFVEELMERCGIMLNRNTVPGDKTALSPSGIRLGTLAITTMGFAGSDILRIADIIHEVIEIASKLTAEYQQGCSLSKELKSISLLEDSIVSAVCQPIRMKVQKLLDRSY